MESDQSTPSSATTELMPGYTVRPLATTDAGALAMAYARNREHLTPWEPRRSPEFFSEPAQPADIQAKLAAAVAGQQDPGSSGTATRRSAGST